MRCMGFKYIVYIYIYIQHSHCILLCKYTIHSCYSSIGTEIIFGGFKLPIYCQPFSAPRFKAGFHISVHRALSGCSTNCALEAQE